MRTEARTVGFGGGFTNAKTTAAERGAAAVVPVRRREALPVPMSATREEAERAFVRLMSREARCRHGHR